MAKGGVAGIFNDEASCLKAAHKVKEMGFKKFDTITPYPVHGMEEALGVKRSWIPYVGFVFAIIGGCAGLYFQYWVHAVDWPMNIAGKPFFSAPAFIPITFEMTVLFSALSSVAALFVVAGLPAIDPPVIDPDLTSHKFAVFIPEGDVGYEAGKCEQLFKDLGASQVKRMVEY
jgi:hypothetical protein